MKATLASGGRYYRPELDVVRLLAFLLVFLHHTLPWSNNPSLTSLSKPDLAFVDAVRSACGFGLSLFFTLSAFLICELLLREREKSGTVSIKQFYIRRILRIWPLYYLGIGLGYLFAYLYRDPPEVHGFLAFLVFLGAWQISLHSIPASPDGMTNPALPLWSISVEEQFYLLAPWLVRYLNPKGIARVCIFIVLFSSCCLAYFGLTSASDRQVWFNTFVQFECFAAGILTCILLRGRLPRISLSRRALLLTFAFACWFVAAYSFHARFFVTSNPGALSLICGYLLVSFGCTLILVSFLGIDPMFLPRWAINLGRISFGLYVFHQFPLREMRLWVRHIGPWLAIEVPSHITRIILSWTLDVFPTLILTCLIAAMSYRYYETPFLKLKKRHAIIESQPLLEEHPPTPSKIAIEI